MSFGMKIKKTLRSKIKEMLRSYLKELNLMTTLKMKELMKLSHQMTYQILMIQI